MRRFCGAGRDGFTCTLPIGHAGAHVAMNPGGLFIGDWRDDDNLPSLDHFAPRPDPHIRPQGWYHRATLGDWETGSRVVRYWRGWIWGTAPWRIRIAAYSLAVGLWRYRYPACCVWAFVWRDWWTPGRSLQEAQAVAGDVPMRWVPCRRCVQTRRNWREDQ